LPNRSSQDCLSPNSLRQFLLFLFCLLGLVTAHAQTVSPDFYNGLKWRLIGPFRGGRAVAVAGVPGNSTTFYFGAVNGGIWKTTDAGVVWEPIFDTQHIASIGALAVAPSDEKIIYAGTGESDIRSDLSSGDGVYKSTDGGQTWTNIGLRDTRQISRIVIDAQNADVAYVAALGHAYGPNAERGVYKTTDGGAHWSKILDQGPEIGAADVAIASTNPNILFATMWHAHRPPWSTYPPIGGPGSGLYRSIDGGKSWTHLTGAGLPDGDWGRAGVAVSPDGRRVYALIDAAKKGLYRSDDGGNTWTLANSDSRLTSRAWYFCGITVDPENPDVIYMPNVALYRSEDGGKTISIVRGAPGGDDYHQIWVDPKDSTRMVLGTDQGTSISLDYGKTWSSWYNQPTAQLYHAIATTNIFPYRVCAGQQESGSVCTSSRGNDGAITYREWHPVGVIEYGYVAPDPLDPDIIYGAGRSSVTKFHWSTGQVQDVTPLPLRNPKYRTDRTEPLMFSPVDPHTMYYSSNVLFKTNDGGNSWQQISKDLTREDPSVPASVGKLFNKGVEKSRGAIYALATSFKNTTTLWAGTDDGLIWITRDGGKNWNGITPKELTAWSKVTQISASHFDDETAYASVSRFRINDMHPYIYRTHDGGKSWNLIVNGLPDFGPVDTVREDPVRKGLLFAGTENAVWVSFDDGDHWQSLQMNLPHTSMRDLWIHDDDLIVGTHGRSFWILDDIAPLREASVELANSAHLFKPAAAYRVQRDTYTDTPLPPDEPMAANPPDGAILDYFLPSPASSVSLEILDAQGKVIRKYANTDKPDITEEDLEKQIIPRYWVRMPRKLSTEAGMHRWVWDLHYSPPASMRHDYPISAVPHNTPRYPLGPNALPGAYKVRLTVDGKSFTQSLTVKMDPRVRTPALGLQKKFETESRLARIVSSSSHALLQAASLREQMEKLHPAGATAEAVESFQKKLGAVTGEAGGFFSPPSAEVTLNRVNGEAATLYQQVWAPDAAPTVPQSEALMTVDHDSEEALKRWNAFAETDLPGLNRILRDANIPEIKLERDPHQEEEQEDEDID
jgi:photosystem II stability/assembly factor-like uncharacterized protein